MISIIDRQETGEASPSHKGYASFLVSDGIMCARRSAVLASREGLRSPWD